MSRAILTDADGRPIPEPTPPGPDATADERAGDLRRGLCRTAMDVTIMVGLPRSGKSTWVRDNMPGAQVVSADHYFTNGRGEYRFDPAKLSEAHAACFRHFLAVLQDPTYRGIEGIGMTDVVVDNTNLTNWERAPYVLAAQTYGYAVRFVHCPASADECIAREDNGHDVPDAAIRRMAKRFERPLPFWLTANPSNWIPADLERCLTAKNEVTS